MTDNKLTIRIVLKPETDEESLDRRLDNVYRDLVGRQRRRWLRAARSGPALALLSVLTVAAGLGVWHWGNGEGAPATLSAEGDPARDLPAQPLRSGGGTLTATTLHETPADQPPTVEPAAIAAEPAALADGSVTIAENVTLPGPSAAATGTPAAGTDWQSVPAADRAPLPARENVAAEAAAVAPRTPKAASIEPSGAASRGGISSTPDSGAASVTEPRREPTESAAASLRAPHGAGVAVRGRAPPAPARSQVSVVPEVDATPDPTAPARTRQELPEAGMPVVATLEAVEPVQPVGSVGTVERLEPGPTGDTHRNVPRAQLTTAVRYREPVDEVASPVTIADRRSSGIYYFTELRGLTGRTIHHVWQYRGRRMARLTFAVRGDRWRVYSSKQLAPSMTGTWQVTVEDADGNVLRRTEFEVIAAQPSG